MKNKYIEIDIEALAECLTRKEFSAAAAEITGGFAEIYEKIDDSEDFFLKEKYRGRFELIKEKYIKLILLFERE